MNPITVNTKTFTRELEWCARFIERKTTIPILTNVMLRKAGDLLYLTGTDLEIGGQTSVEADGPDFELTVPVHLLLKYLKKVDDQTLQLIPRITYRAAPYGPHIEGCEGNATEGCCRTDEVSAVRLSVRHGEDGAVDIDGMPVTSYPEVPARPLSSIEIGGLETAIPRVIVAISTEETRFTLNGALLDIKDRTAQLIATDGHRLSVADAKVFDVEWRLRNKAKPFRALIPKQALLELARLGDSAFLCRDEHHVFFTVGERTIVSRVLTGSFPDWERVLPTEFKFSVSVPSLPLKKVIDRVALFADERSHCIELSVNGTLKIVAKQHEHTASGQVPFVGPAFAYPYVAGFNASYLTDFLKTANVDAFDLRFNKASVAAECDAPGWRYVLMPMRNGDEQDPVVEGAYEPVPAVIAYLDAQAQAVEAPACDQCSEPLPAEAETALCQPCDAGWERAAVEQPAPEPEPAPISDIDKERRIVEAQLAKLAPEPGRIRCVTCSQDLEPAAFEIRWDTRKPRRSCRSCRKQPRSVSATLQVAVA